MKLCYLISLLACCLSFINCNSKKQEETFDENKSMNKISHKKLVDGKYSLELIASDTLLYLIPNGFDKNNDTLIHDINGLAINDFICADLNNDGYNDYILYLNVEALSSHGDIIAYASNNGKSLSQIYYNTTVDLEGYRGDDTFSLSKENLLIRRFPLYATTEKKINKNAILLYSVESGEAGQYFKIDSVEIK